MAEAVKKTRKSEEQIAKEYNMRLQREFIASRNLYILGSVVCFLAAVGMVYVDLPMMVLVMGGLGMICVLQALDAQGTLQEVRRRQTKTLWSHMSKPLFPERDSPAKSPSS